MLPGVARFLERTPFERHKRRDENQKRDLYLAAGVAEYWMVDPERRAIIVIKRVEANRVVTGEMTWHPPEASAALVFLAARVFERFRP